MENIDNWPRRLLYVPSMTSYEWQRGNRYGEHIAPKYNALSYTWGRWRLPTSREKPHVQALEVKGVPWDIPRVDPDLHFTTDQFSAVLHQMTYHDPQRVAWQKVSHSKGNQPPNLFWQQIPAEKIDFVWLDVACIDQRWTPETKSEIGRQACIFKGAHQRYVWLSHTCTSLLETMVDDLELSLKDLGGRRGNLSKLEEWAQIWLGKVVSYADELLKDPWYSSLWTLQEAYVCPALTVFSQEPQIVGLGQRSLEDMYGDMATRLEQIISGGRPNEKLTGTSKAQANHLLNILKRSGILQFQSASPLSAYTVARYRTTSIEVDYIYGIMQIFEFRLGSSAEGAEPDREFTLPELEDQLGAAFVKEGALTSQLFVHLRKPTYAKAWRLSRHVDIPSFARVEFGDLAHTVKAGDVSTIRYESDLWGWLSGKSCSFGALGQAWMELYKICGILAQKVAYDFELRSWIPQLVGITTPVRYQPILVQAITEVFKADILRVFLLGGWPGRGEKGKDLTLWGIILLQQKRGKLMYWHRLGIVKWFTWPTLSPHNDIPATPILRGESADWEPLSGYFG
jgi:hypothetical protein